MSICTRLVVILGAVLLTGCASAQVEHPSAATSGGERLRSGKAYLRDKDYVKAQECFEAILDAGSDDEDLIFGAYLGLGESCFAQSRFKEALSDGFLRVVIMNDRNQDVPLDFLAPALFWSARCFDQLRGEHKGNRAFADGLYRELDTRAPDSGLTWRSRRFRRSITGSPASPPGSAPPDVGAGASQDAPRGRDGETPEKEKRK